MAAKDQALAWDFGFPSIDEGRLDLAAFKGRVLLVTNTASFCGYTYQYKGLETLHKAGEARGLTVIGVPSQDFHQESPDNKTVKEFCEVNFAVGFPMAGIVHVRGAQAADRLADPIHSLSPLCRMAGGAAVRLTGCRYAHDVGGLCEAATTRSYACTGRGMGGRTPK